MRGLGDVTAGGVQLQGTRVVPVVHQPAGSGDGSPTGGAPAAGWPPAVLPFTLRFQVVKKPQLLKRLEVRLVRAVWRWQRREARRRGVTAPLEGGAVVFTQWFGSMLQLIDQSRYPT